MIDERMLRLESQQIEHELAELHDQVEPATWERIEHVLRVTLALYGTGLAHALDCARRAGADAQLDALLADDELLGSLLVLHGLHPLPTEARVRRTVDAVRVELGLDEQELVVDSVEDGVAHLTATDRLGRGELTPRAAAALVVHAIENAAPELDTVEITGFDTSATVVA